MGFVASFAADSELRILSVTSASFDERITRLSRETHVHNAEKRRFLSREGGGMLWRRPVGFLASIP